MRHLQKKIKTGTLNLNQDDPFELFIAATNIRYCYYNETHKILGNTFGMCVLQVSFLLRYITKTYNLIRFIGSQSKKSLGTTAVDWRCTWLFGAFIFCLPGLWSSHSQSVGENCGDSRRRRYSGDSAEDNELSQAAVHYDHGKSLTCSISTRHNLLPWLHHYFSVQDVHSRYRTEAHQDVVGRFNER